MTSSAKKNAPRDRVAREQISRDGRIGRRSPSRTTASAWEAPMSLERSRQRRSKGRSRNHRCRDIVRHPPGERSAELAIQPSLSMPPWRSRQPAASARIANRSKRCSNTISQTERPSTRPLRQQLFGRERSRKPEAGRRFPPPIAASPHRCGSSTCPNRIPQKSSRRGKLRKEIARFSREPERRWANRSCHTPTPPATSGRCRVGLSSIELDG
ncbi:hypothetical protein EC9_16170 [Rosistilla ulvae]|uniref:Uncharacterized protein n=1 Tax=Rosistilla ulvae TaxID=1930277 RepID=A0A517LXU8_9BACT|nr:hypothetical protein EC9_16170 [Rosistilla ulvae]